MLMKKFITLLLVLTGMVSTANAAKKVYLLSDVTTWTKGDVTGSLVFDSEWDEANSRDIHTATINVSGRSEDINFRLWFNGWGKQICPKSNHTFDFSSNGKTGTYNDIWYDNTDFQCDGNYGDKTFKIPHSTTQAYQYKITLYDVYGSNTMHIKVDIVSMPLTMAAEKGTFSCAYALDFTGTGIDAYMITGASAGTLTPSSAMTKVPANTGLYLEGSTGTVYIPVVTTSEASEVSTSGNMLVPGAGSAVAATSGANTNFILTNKTTSGDAPLKFYKANGNTVPAGKAYLQIPTASVGAHESFWFDDETTGINEIKQKVELTGKYYNLAGQRVAQPTKGLYIVNGKKVIMK